MKSWMAATACLFLSLSGVGCSDEGTGTDVEDPRLTVAYIHTGAASWGAEFKTVLDASDFPTTLIDLAQPGDPNLAGFSLIMLDARSVWTWPDDRTLIEQSGHTVLALGYAGAVMLDSLGLSIGSGNCHVTGDTTSTLDGDTRLFLPEPGDDLFTIPIPFHVPPDSIIQVYDHSACVAVYEAGMADSAYGAATVPAEKSEFPLAGEGARWALWGFSGAPGAMTQTGRDLLINVVDALASPD